ncbi:MAG: type III-B CRISPR module RAMP protein Cmr1 [Candidatus Polarisedimenticolaceae bacterium]|nr:type III-B CRISPR module RAMP protein Cmr1 [Candidatus Polarisedimenticolaceae bacterium]
MKLREPKLKQLKAELTRLKEHPWRKFDVELITPIFGGGVTAGSPDEKMPIRTAAIRGQLRYWWRFLQKSSGNSTTEKIFKAERAFWGGMGENGQGHASTIKMRVNRVQLAKDDIVACAEYEKDHKIQSKFKSIPKFKPFVHGYALFPGRGTLSENRETIKQKPANIIKPGIRFQLEIQCLSNQEKEVIETLRWWATFGGIGARTRRGVGSIKIVGLDPITKAETEAKGCKLVICSSVEELNAIDAWKKAVDCLQDFRQGAQIGRNHKKDESGNLLYHDQKGHTPQLGRSYWPEPDSIREIVNTHCKIHSPSHTARCSFPRAAFGLPIIFKFKDDKARDPQQTELQPIDADRMASPLILTPYPQQGGIYAPAALLLPTDECLNSLVLRLSTEPDNNADRLKRKGWDKWSTNWWDSSKANDVLPIKNHAGTDALSAFMRFFAQGGRKP